MEKTNIFTTLANSFDFGKEIFAIDTLLSNGKILLKKEYYSKTASGSIKEFANSIFYLWDGRETATSIDDFSYRLGVNDILQKITWGRNIDSNEIITYLEYASNVIHIFELYFYNKKDYLEANFNNYYICKKNLSILVEKLNLTEIAIKEKEGVELVQASTETIDAVESLPEELAISILRYQHPRLIGNLGKKRAIIIEMYHDFEPIRKVLSSNNFTTIVSDIGLCVNKLDIRHNNRDEVVSNMEELEIEEWYDYTYQLLLLGFSIKKYLVTRVRIDAIKPQKKSSN